MTIENMVNYRDDCMLVKPEELLRMALEDIGPNGDFQHSKKAIILLATESVEPGKLEVRYYKAGTYGLEAMALCEMGKLKFADDLRLLDD